jgi:hypothetical protein
MYILMARRAVRWKDGLSRDDPTSSTPRLCRRGVLTLETRPAPGSPFHLGLRMRTIVVMIAVGCRFSFDD